MSTATNGGDLARHVRRGCFVSPLSFSSELFLLWGDPLVSEGRASDGESMTTALLEEDGSPRLCEDVVRQLPGHHCPIKTTYRLSSLNNEVVLDGWRVYFSLSLYI